MYEHVHRFEKTMTNNYFYLWRKYSQQKSCKNGKAKHLQSKVNRLEKNIFSKENSVRRTERF